MTLLRSGMTARYTLPDDTVYELIVSKESQLEAPADSEAVDRNLTEPQAPDSGAV